jgi:NADH-quinone oxidoreductase subunit C
VEERRLGLGQPARAPGPQALSEPAHPLVERLRAWDAAAIADVVEFRGELTVVVAAKELLRLCSYLRGIDFDFLSDVSATDRFPLEPRFEVNYHLLSIPTRQTLRLKVRLEGGDPEVQSVTSIWPTAAWHEREVFDLFGIRFAGHPDLRRIMMPDDWEGHPLRKDFPVTGYR